MGFRSLEALQAEMESLIAPRSIPLTTGASVREPSSGGEGLELFSYPLLVDEGRLSVDADELKQALGDVPFVELHPAEAGRLGLEDGATARIKTEAGEVELPVRLSDGIAEGAAFVPWNQRGFRANTLFNGVPRASATIEATSVKEEVAG
jgi:predicted molibdopterin-dependent oxidoreductase YjgC